MLRKKSTYLSIIFLVLNISICIAQADEKNNFQVRGVVRSKIGEPIPSGVVVLTAEGGKLEGYKAGIDTMGQFVIRQVAVGTYGFRVNAIGYKALIGNVSVIDKDIVLDKLILSDSSVMLKEVSIEALEQKQLKSENGKLIIDATDKVYKTSSNALDLISKLPATTVVNDNIKINGTVEPVVLIDGKRSPLTIQELKNLPAKQIRKIELIANPGPEYEGTYNAVINILLDRNDSVDGYNLNGYLGYGRNLFNQAYSGLELVHQKNKVQYLQINYDFSRYKGYLDLENQRKTTTDQSNTSYFENSFSEQTPTSHTVRINYEKTLNDISKLGLNVRGVYGNYKENTASNSILSFADQAVQNQNLSANADLFSKNKSVAATLFYQLKYNKNTEFSAQVNYNYFDQEQEQYINIINYAVNGESLTHNNLESNIELLNFNVDLKTNIWQSVTLTTGIKGGTSPTNNTMSYDTAYVDHLVRDSSRTNHFIYDEQVYAGYINASKQMGGVNLSTGIRYEYTKGTGKLITSDEHFVREYGNWLPYVNLSREFFNKKLNVNLSYSKKIQRPSFSDLNPFSIISSPYTRVEGNPYLAPAIFNNYELNLNIRNVNLGISYRKRDNLISQMPFYDFDNHILTLRMVNINSRKSWAYNLSYNKAVVKWYTVQLSGTLLNDDFNTQFNGKNYHLNGYNYSITASNAFTVKPDLLLTLNGYYTSPSVYDIYKFRPQGSLSVGFRKSFLNKRLVLVAEYRDMFLTMKDRLAQQTDGFQNNIKQFRASRVLDVRLEFDLQRLSNSIKTLNIRSSDEESRIK